MIKKIAAYDSPIAATLLKSAERVFFFFLICCQKIVTVSCLGGYIAPFSSFLFPILSTSAIQSLAPLTRIAAVLNS